MFKKFFSIVFSITLVLFSMFGCYAEQYISVSLSPDIMVYETDDAQKSTKTLMSVPVEYLSEYPNQLLDRCNISGQPITLRFFSNNSVYKRLLLLIEKICYLTDLSMQQTEEFQYRGCINNESVYKDLEIFPQVQIDFFEILLHSLHSGILS